MKSLVTMTLDKWLYMTEPGLSTNSQLSISIIKVLKYMIFLSNHYLIIINLAVYLLAYINNKAYSVDKWHYLLFCGELWRIYLKVFTLLALIQRVDLVSL